MKRCAKRYITQLLGIISLFVYKASLFSVRHCLKKGIITLEDLTTDSNDVITGFQIMASASFTPKEKFQFMAIIDAIPTQWRNHFKMCNNYQNNSLVSNSAQLYLNGHNFRLDKASSKNIYKEVHSKVKIIPTSQLKYSEKYNYQLD